MLYKNKFITSFQICCFQICCFLNSVLVVEINRDTNLYSPTAPSCGIPLKKRLPRTAKSRIGQVKAASKQRFESSWERKEASRLAEVYPGSGESQAAVPAPPHAAISWWGSVLESQICWDKTYHFSATGVQGELWEKAGGKARSWVRSLLQKQLYWEMFGFWGQKSKWKVRDHHSGKCPWEHSFPLLQRWAGCTTQTNAYTSILASFPLFLTWYCMSWGSSCPTAAQTMLQQPCWSNVFAVEVFLGTGTHGEPLAHPSSIRVHSYCFEAKRKPTKPSWTKIRLLCLPQSSHPGTSLTRLNSNIAWQFTVLPVVFPISSSHYNSGSSCQFLENHSSYPSWENYPPVVFAGFWCPSQSLWWWPRKTSCFLQGPSQTHGLHGNRMTQSRTSRSGKTHQLSCRD